MVRGDISQSFSTDHASSYGMGDPKRLQARYATSDQRPAYDAAGQRPNGYRIVFTLVLQATGNQAILPQTLEYTSGLMCRYQVMEDFHRSDANAANSPGHKVGLLKHFEDHLTDLYAAILEFQSHAINYLGEHSVVRLLDDAFDTEGWSGISQGIKDHGARTEKDAQMIGTADVDQRLRSIQSTKEYKRARRIIAEHDKTAIKYFRTPYTAHTKTERTCIMTERVKHANGL